MTPDHSTHGPHKGLRLSAILAGLAADAEIVDPAGEAHASQGSPTTLESRPPRKVRTSLTIGDIVDRTRKSGFGFLTGFLALIAVPFVGLSTPFGLVIAVGAIQMIFGMSRPWLPAWVRRHAVSLATLNWLSHRLSRWTAGLERAIRPRFEILTAGPFWSLCGFCILLQAVGLALPLPIPGTNWPFIIVIVLYAIGLLERDGLLVMICHALTAVEIVLAFRFWHLIVQAWHLIQEGALKAMEWVTKLGV